MEAQVQNAVEVALNPQAEYALKQQALAFIAQVKDSPDAWRVALSLLTNQPSRPAPVRHFALQILESAIKRGFLHDVSASEQTRAVLLQLLDPGIADQNHLNLRVEPQYLQNQVAHSLTLLFVSTYTTTWTSFFNDFLALIQRNARQGHPYDYFTTQIFLRILSMIDQEVADALYTSSKKTGDHRMNTDIKDRIREYDVSTIVRFMFDVMTAFQGETELEGLVGQCLSVIGQWIAWIDITLIVNDAYMTLIYRFLGHNGLRTAASETLASIVSKKMHSVDKLELINLLNLTQVVESLEADEDVEFSEAMARLVNVQGLELTRIIVEASSSPEISAKAMKALTELVPHLLRFLSDEYDDTSMAVFPFLSEMLFVSRRSAKRTKTQVLDRKSLQAVLSALFKKMRYDDDDHSQENDDSDLEAEFHDLRKRLLAFQESIAVLDPALYSESVFQFVTNTFKILDSAPDTDWRDTEVALVELHSFAEPLKANGLWENTEHVQRFAQMLSQLISLAPKLFHPLTGVLFMEIIVRYSAELLLQLDLIPAVLEFFVGSTGIHSAESHVQFRGWYLFDRLLGKMQGHLVSISGQILAAFSDLLQIRVPAASLATNPSGDGDSDSDSEQQDVFFDSQLYLFQSAGLLIASTQSSNFEVGQALLQSLGNNIQERIQAPSIDQIDLLYVHHTIMAIGDIAKGFDNASEILAPTREQAVNLLFIPATEIILKALTRFEDSILIRDATRHAFARLVPVMGKKILSKIPPLIGGLLRQSTTGELIDFLPFLGQLIHKFKPNIHGFLDELMLPLLSKIFESLNKPVEGTDDVVEQTSMRKAYLSFILNLLNNRMEPIFVSDVNRSKFESILESIVQYATDTSDATVEKVAFGVLNKMVVVWSDPVSGSTNVNGEGLSSGFHDAFGQFVIGHLSRVCFEVPSKSTFNSNDAQSRLVLAEIAGLQKSIYQMKGDTFSSFLQANFFPSLGVPPAAADEYVRALKQLDLKQFKKYFLTFVSR